MLIKKAFRYRIYPTKAQEARLLSWESSLRFLWNLAHEQRLMGVARQRGERIYPSAYAQMLELTALRAELPWLADVPRNACSKTLSQLDDAWRRCFTRRSRRPRWKARGGRAVGIVENKSASWHLRGQVLYFPKLGNVRIVVHRPVSGAAKSCTITREAGNQWFASLFCEIDTADPTPRSEPVVALDRGITHLVADSDGNLHRNPKHLERSLTRLAHAQRVVSRRKKGSENREKAKLVVARLHRKVRRQREHVLHFISAAYAKSHGTVVVERLNVQGMIRNPYLARHIADAGWGKLTEMLRYKLTWSGGSLVEVPAAYSSQTCSACGTIDAASRHGERFACTSCGHAAHADLNAALILKSRASRSALPVDGIALEATGRSRKPDYMP